MDTVASSRNFKSSLRASRPVRARVSSRYADVHAREATLDESGATLVVDGVDERYDLVIAADGQKSEFRNLVASTQPLYSGYVLWRGMVPLDELSKPPLGIVARRDHFETFGYPVSGTRTFANVGFYVATPQDEVPPLSRNRQIAEKAPLPSWFLPFVDTVLGPDASDLWRTIVAKGKVAPHPVWLFAADAVVNKRLALLGDAAHTATPRTARGAYTALVDAAVLGQALQQYPDDLDAALAVYNANVARRSNDLLHLSLEIGRRSFLPKPGVPLRSPASFVTTSPPKSSA